LDQLTLQLQPGFNLSLELSFLFIEGILDVSLLVNYKVVIIALLRSVSPQLNQGLLLLICEGS
jgi:hypothetical protein